MTSRQDTSGRLRQKHNTKTAHPSSVGKTSQATGVLREPEDLPENTRRSGWTANVLLDADRSVHDWYRFVLSFPPHLVDDYMMRFGVGSSDIVLDPFCGTGTTIVEAKKQNVAGVGIEAHPVAVFATKVKTCWDVDPKGLRRNAETVASSALRALADSGITDDGGDGRSGNLRTLPDDSMNLLITNSISPRPLHKVLVLLDTIEELGEDSFRDLLRLAAAKTAVAASNLRFGPEVGLGTIRDDVPVIRPWLHQVGVMAADLSEVTARPHAPAKVLHADSRELSNHLEPSSIDAVITSPPYPNEKDYTRTTRLEAVLLGFIKTKADLRQMKQALLRSNTRGVYKGDTDHQFVSQFHEIEEIAQAIERRRIELGKTSGFERLYPKVTKLYFGGMARHLADLRPCLKPGAQLAYVVGDQASYLRVMIRTGALLAKIARSLGYEVLGLDLFRTRWSTATKEQLREEVVVLRWPGR